MNQRVFKTGIFSVQWFVFLVANSLILPIVVGQIFHLSSSEIIGLIQRMFFVVGISSLITGWFGHRLPIADGPAGIWVGIFVLMGQLAASQGSDPKHMLQLLEGGMLITGLAVVLISLLGWVRIMLRVFTPLVTGVYLIMLTLQLSGTMLKGMVGLNGASASVSVDPTSIILSFAVFLLVLALSIWGKSWMRSYAVLFGVIAGWAAYACVSGVGTISKSASLFRAPELFAWGMPAMNSGMLVTSIIVAFILTSSVIASRSAMELVADQTQPESREKSLNHGGIAAGLSNVFCSLFAAIGVVPLTISAGFVRLTGQRNMRPFYYACALLILVSFVPGIYSVLSLLPAQVANAAMLASFAQMIGIGMRSILKEALDERRLTILGLALSFGTGVMFLPQDLFNTLPALFQYLLGNGVMVGMIVALALEQAWREKKPEREPGSRAASGGAASV